MVMRNAGDLARQFNLNPNDTNITGAIDFLIANPTSAPNWDFWAGKLPSGLSGQIRQGKAATVSGPATGAIGGNVAGEYGVTSRETTPEERATFAEQDSNDGYGGVLGGTFMKPLNAYTKQLGENPLPTLAATYFALNAGQNAGWWDGASGPAARTQIGGVNIAPNLSGSGAVPSMGGVAPSIPATSGTSFGDLGYNAGHGEQFIENNLMGSDPIRKATELAVNEGVRNVTRETVNIPLLGDIPKDLLMKAGLGMFLGDTIRGPQMTDIPEPVNPNSVLGNNPNLQTALDASMSGLEPGANIDFMDLFNQMTAANLAQSGRDDEAAMRRFNETAQDRGRFSSGQTEIERGDMERGLKEKRDVQAAKTAYTVANLAQQQGQADVSARSRALQDILSIYQRLQGIADPYNKQAFNQADLTNKMELADQQSTDEMTNLLMAEMFGWKSPFGAGA